MSTVKNLNNLGTVWDINDAGAMTGISGIQPDAAILYPAPDPTKPYFNAPAYPEWYKFHPIPKQATTIGTAINDAGDIVGYALVDDVPGVLGRRAFFRDGTTGKCTDLHALVRLIDGVVGSEATDINAGGSIVGLSNVGPWQITYNSANRSWGTAQSLNSRFGLPLPPTVISRTVFINDNGSIVLETDQNSYLWSANGNGGGSVFAKIPVSVWGSVYGFNNNNQVLLWAGGVSDPVLFWPGSQLWFIDITQFERSAIPNYIPGPRSYLTSKSGVATPHPQVLVPEADLYSGAAATAYLWIAPPITPGALGQSHTIPGASTLAGGTSINLSLSYDLNLTTVWGINNKGVMVGQDASGNTVLITP